MFRTVRRVLHAVALLAATQGAAAHAFSGVIRYTGDLGPVGSARPLCLCVFTDPDLERGIGCLIFRRNDAPYEVELDGRDYYVVAFLDIHINEILDPDEPFEIYRERGRTPGDPIVGSSTESGVDFVFGDENLAPPTPTATDSPTLTATSSPSITATPPPTSTSLPTCATPMTGDGAGDCNGDGRVAINELIVMVRIALGESALAACAAADASGDGAVQIAEIVAAVRRSLTGC